MYKSESDKTVVLDKPCTKFYFEKYKIVDVAHVNNRGKLFISCVPGLQDINSDLAEIKSKVDVVVCLLQWSELLSLNLLNYPKKAQEKGLLFYHLQIKDLSAPSQEELKALIPLLVNSLSQGSNVLVHCKAGLGRAGAICACCLIHFGLSAEKSINIVRNQRPGAIQSKKQEDCIINYANNFNKYYKTTK